MPHRRHITPWRFIRHHREDRPYVIHHRAFLRWGWKRGLVPRRLSEPLIDIERHQDALHVWVGPAGVHLFWPDVWKSRPDWCSTWVER
jgi:hypothetical protein